MGILYNNSNTTGTIKIIILIIKSILLGDNTINIINSTKLLKLFILTFILIIIKNSSKNKKNRNIIPVIIISLIKGSKVNLD